MIFAFPLTFVHKSLPESNRREQKKVKKEQKKPLSHALSAVQSPRPYILLHCLTNSKINFSQHSHCERVVKTKESVCYSFNCNTHSSQSRFFPKVHRHCELPLKHYKQRREKETKASPPPPPPLHAGLLTDRFVSWSIVTQTCINTGKPLDFLLPSVQVAYSKTKKHTTWICCCSTFVAMLCSGVNNLVFQWHMITGRFKRNHARFIARRDPNKLPCRI